SSRRRHTRSKRDWSSDVCSSDLIADVLHIEEVYSGCLPQEKLSWIEQSQKRQIQVCMIGDGINDAPSLKKAFVGIAMGGVGSDKIGRASCRESVKGCEMRRREAK